MKLVKTLLAASVAMIAVPTMAYEAGDIMVKAGVINVNPKDDNLNLGGGTKVQVEDDTQLGLTLTYMVTPHIGVEVLAATPFKHSATIDGDRIGTTQHLPPTVSVQYYPLSASGSEWQPYVGLGVNHTFFYDEKGALDTLKGLDRSWGLAYSAGLNYHIDDNWMANVAVWKVDIDAELRAVGKDVEIDPLVIMVGAGYKF
ncbi:MAG: outer membrane beta-barrel protein [Bacterioplanes sp.]|nr:outer membrane beta-barrel protein [Bacterioplanes sp.]